MDQWMKHCSTYPLNDFYGLKDIFTSQMARRKTLTAFMLLAMKVTSCSRRATQADPSHSPNPP